VVNHVTVSQTDSALLKQIDRALQETRRRRPNRNGDAGFVALLASAQPQADPAFEPQLEARLVGTLYAQVSPRLETEQGIAGQRVQRARQPWFTARWRRAWTAVATLVTVMALVLLVLGPGQVWAHVQRWLGYVPGVGFVHLGETRTLGAPVAVTRDGVTVIVNQVLAQPDRTLILLSSEGLPPEDEIWPTGPSSGAIVEPVLELASGQVLTATTFNLNWGAGTLAFPPLSGDIHQVTLVLPRLPLVPEGIAPEDWRIPLNLRSETGDEVADQFPQPYAPPGAEDTRRGVTVRLLGVAHSPEETALHLQVQWTMAEWSAQVFGAGYEGLALHDDLGHVYHKTIPASTGSTSQSEVVKVQVAPDTTPTPTPAVPTADGVETFAPVSTVARHLTYTVSGLRFDVPAEGRFSLDLGEHPEIGDTWPLDIDLQVAGFPVHLSRARWQEQHTTHDGEAWRWAELRLDFDPVQEQDGITLCGVQVTAETNGFQSGGGGGYNRTSNRMRAVLDVPEGEPLPKGSVDLVISGAQLCLNETWRFSWEIPFTDPAEMTRAMPLRYRPEGAAQTHKGLTLEVEEAVLTDRLTWVAVGLADAPKDVTLFRGYSPRGPGAYPRGVALTDDRGHVYEHPFSVSWRPSERSDPHPGGFVFEPLQPLARRLTLQLPALAVVQADPKVLDVIVPEGVPVTLDASDAPWAMSEPWKVDIALEVAGYPVHYTQAQLQEVNGTTLLFLTSAPYRPQGTGRELLALKIGSVTAPDGRKVDLESALSTGGPQQENDRMRQTVLAFDVVDPDAQAVQPGLYHVEIDGAIVLAEGRWELSWPVPGP
jgi:hypothetical protein